MMSNGTRVGFMKLRCRQCGTICMRCVSYTSLHTRIAGCTANSTLHECCPELLEGERALLDYVSMADRPLVEYADSAQWSIGSELLTFDELMSRLEKEDDNLWYIKNFNL